MQATRIAPFLTPWTRTVPRGIACVAAVLLALLWGPVHPAFATDDLGAGRATAPAVPESDRLFEDLAALEDPALAEHRAGDLSGDELAVVIIFMILFLPLGLLLLIAMYSDEHYYYAEPPPPPRRHHHHRYYYP